MSKNPKSIVVSFRLSPLVVAKAIDGLKNYDKSAQVDKLSSIIKQTTLHGINYLTQPLPWEPSIESQRIVHSLTNQGRQTELPGIEQEILSQPIKVFLDSKEAKSAQSEPEALETKSIKSTVTDFSIPQDLLDEATE